jgi:hypothetical protein
MPMAAGKLESIWSQFCIFIRHKHFAGSWFLYNQKTNFQQNDGSWYGFNRPAIFGLGARFFLNEVFLSWPVWGLK